MGGGRIIRDKLWFYVTYRQIGPSSTVPGMWVNKNAGNPNAWTVDFDTSRPGVHRHPGAERDRAHHVAGDAAQQVQRPLVRAVQHARTRRAAAPRRRRRKRRPDRFYSRRAIQQATWSSPVSSRLLLEAGWGTYQARYRNPDAADRRHPQPPDDPGAGTGRRDPEPDLPDAGRRGRRLQSSPDRDAGEPAGVGRRMSPARTT